MGAAGSALPIGQNLGALAPARRALSPRRAVEPQTNANWRTSIGALRQTDDSPAG
jgi:hypothetical protein